jgi:hypothetical protein
MPKGESLRAHREAEHTDELLDCVPFHCVHKDCPASEPRYCGYVHLYRKTDSLWISFHQDEDKLMCEHMWKLGSALADYTIRQRKNLLSPEEERSWFCSFCVNLMPRGTYKCPSCGYSSDWRKANVLK